MQLEAFRRRGPTNPKTDLCHSSSDHVQIATVGPRCVARAKG